MPLDEGDIRYLEAKFGSVHETLTRIDTQVTKTNGRVDEHDVKLGGITSALKLHTRALTFLSGVLTTVVLYLVSKGILPTDFFK